MSTLKFEIESEIAFMALTSMNVSFYFSCGLRQKLFAAALDSERMIKSLGRSHGEFRYIDPVF